MKKRKEIKPKTSPAENNPQSTNTRDNKPKVQLLEEYFNYKSWNKDFMTNTKMERLGLELVQWVHSNEDAIKVNQFLAEKGIADSTWKEWCQKYEFLGKAHNHAKMIIGNRREHGMIHKKYEPHSAGFMMPMYDSDWDAMMKKREDLKKKDDIPAGQQFVVIEKYPESPLVPKMRKEREQEKA